MFIRQTMLFVTTMAAVAASIAIGGMRERTPEQSPKLRITNSWPLKFQTGKPVTTPILYCGSEHAKGYYKVDSNLEHQNFTAYEDDLCESVATWRWIGAPVTVQLVAVLLAAMYSARAWAKHIRASRAVVLVVILVARYVFWKWSDEPRGAEFDSSDHVLLLTVYIWALLWDAWTAVEKRNGKWPWGVLVDAFWTVAFLVSLAGTAGIFHTVDECWAGWRDTAYFLIFFGMIAAYLERERPNYFAVPMNDLGKLDAVPTNDIFF